MALKLKQEFESSIELEQRPARPKLPLPQLQISAVPLQK